MSCDRKTASYTKKPHRNPGKTCRDEILSMKGETKLRQQVGRESKIRIPSLPSLL